MYNPYESVHVLKFSNYIESFAAYDDTLLIGTRQGHLVVYTVTKKYGEQKYDLQLSRYNKNFYRKPIQQLGVVPQLKLLIILVDNTVFVHDLSAQNFPLISTLQETKGATLFSMDVQNQSDKSLTHEQSYIVRLCVAVKRKLVVLYWKNNKFLELYSDIPISDVPKTMAWCMETICLGFKNDYVLVQLNSDEEKKEKDLFPNGKNPEPNVIKLNESTFALVKDMQSIFVNTKGDLLTNNAVKWTEMPIALTYDEPYLIALLNETIEVRTMQPSLLIQSIPVEKAKLISRCSSGRVYVSTGFHIWILQSISVKTQISMLIEEKQFQIALQLCNISDDPEEEKIKERHRIRTLYAYDLFHNKQYHESMKQFSELNTDPYDVIRLYPELLPHDSQDDPTDVSSLKLQNRDTEKSIVALIEYLTEARLKLLLLKNSNKISVQEDTLQKIDTALLKCYILTNDALIAPLIRLNNCNIVDSEKILKKHKKYSELIILYQTKGQHYKALELLEKQADQQDSSLYGPHRTIHYLQNLGREYIDLILQFSGWVLKKYPEDGLKIFTDEIPEVEQLPRTKIYEYLHKTTSDLVIPYLEHVIHVWNDDSSMLHNELIHQYRKKIFTLSNSSSSTDQLAASNLRTKLLTFLEKSNHYAPDSVLSQFPVDGLYEERALLLAKLGLHEQALSIYVTVLGDLEKAIQYCDRIYKEKNKGSKNVYVLLLQLLIDAPDNWLVGIQPPALPQADVDMALSLLDGNALRIPPLNAIQTLPDNVPVQRLQNYLTSSMTQLLTERRKSQILRGLLYAELLKIQEKRISLESKKVYLNECNICAVCKKRFGNQSAFLRIPNGDVIHFSCQVQDQ